MYERFTDRARRVMQLANEEAQRFNHEYIGTEHILLGLVKENSGVAANVLKNLDVDLVKVRREVVKIIQAGPHAIQLGRMPQTPRAKKVIEYAIEEARKLNHNYVGTEHLLLGLLREDEGVASQVLMNLGLRLEDVRAEVRRLLGQLPTECSPDDESLTSTDPDVRIDVPAKETDKSTRIGVAIAAFDQIITVLNDMKEGAVSAQDFEWAASLRDQADKLKKMKDWLLRNQDHKPPETGITDLS
jgi:ATP-dependent Clp protease ATP-binding subunit ClpA